MYPVLFSIGTCEIRSSYLFLTLGIILGVLVGRKEANRVGFSNRDIFTFAMVAIPIALFLGILNGYLFRMLLYREYVIVISFIQSGMISFGAVLGVFLISWIYSLISKQPAGKGFDVIALVMPLILAVYRIGCLLNGCCYGRVTDGFGGVYLPGAFGEWSNRYPTQIMLAAFDFALFGFLWWRRKRKQYEGNQTITFFLIYSIGRLSIDSFRDLPPIAGGFSTHQFASLAILIVAIWIALINRVLHLRRKRQSH